MKKLALALAAGLLALSLTGCFTPTYTCFACGKEEKGKPYIYEDFGKDEKLCKDCYDLVVSVLGEQ